MQRKGLFRVISSVMVLALAISFNTLTASASVQNDNKNQVKVKVIKKDKTEGLVEITNKKTGEKVYVAASTQDITNDQSDITINKDVLKSVKELDKSQKADFLNKLESEGKIDNTVISGTKTNFQIFNTKEQAEALIENLKDSTKNRRATVATFWHGSTVEAYTSWAGYGLHIHLSGIDTSYITNMGWLSADTMAGALAAAGIVSGGAAVVIGAILTAAVITISWREANSDGSLDVWSPERLRAGTNGSLVKIGSHWYYV